MLYFIPLLRNWKLLKVFMFFRYLLKNFKSYQQYLPLALVPWQNQAFVGLFDLHFQNDISKTRTMLYVLIVSEELEAWQDAIQGWLLIQHLHFVEYEWGKDWKQWYMICDIGTPCLATVRSPGLLGIPLQ